MAELIIKVGQFHGNPSGQDGDIICAFNQRRIRCTHAQHICHIMKFGFTRDGLRPSSMAKTFQELTKKYLFLRVSRTEVLRTEIGTSNTTLLNGTPIGRLKETINVEEYLAARVRHNRHKIFGTLGNEFWFGGFSDYSNSMMNTVWNAIETDTPNREVNFTQWPVTRYEKRLWLPITVNDFNERQAADLVERVYEQQGVDDNGRPYMVMIKKRKRFVPWADFTWSRSTNEILDRTQETDVRGASRNRAQLVEVKS